MFFRRRLVNKQMHIFFSRGPEQSSTRKMAGNGSSSATILVDEVRTRRSWLHSLDFQWSSSFCIILSEFSPNRAARPEGSSIWGPVSATTWPSVSTPAVAILLAIVPHVQLGRSNLIPHHQTYLQLVFPWGLPVSFPSFYFRQS